MFSNIMGFLDSESLCMFTGGMFTEALRFVMVFGLFLGGFRSAVSLVCGSYVLEKPPSHDDPTK